VSVRIAGYLDVSPSFSTGAEKPKEGLFAAEAIKSALEIVQSVNALIISIKRQFSQCVDRSRIYYREVGL
jgi:hypothetical protein